MNTVCYVMNRVYLKLSTDRTAYEMCKGRKPNLSCFNVFRSTCHILKNKKNMVGKFDLRVYEGIFLGYSLNNKMYKVYNKRTLKVKEPIDIRFDKITDYSNEEDEVEPSAGENTIKETTKKYHST